MFNDLKYYYIQLGSFHRFMASNIAKANLELNGFKEVFNINEAKYCIINSTVLTNDFKNKTIDSIYYAIDWKLMYVQYRKIAVIGGASQFNLKNKITDKFFKLVDYWCGMDDYKDISNILLQNKPPTLTNNWINEENLPQLNSRKDCMGYIQIQDGCNNFCSYCILPYITGKPRSRSIESIKKEIINKVNLGIKHLVLTAQNVSLYGLDKNINLIDLIKELDKIELDFTYMFINMNICNITNDEINIILNSKKCLNFFDLPIQHCNNEILKKMNRKITQQNIIQKINLIRSCKDLTYIRTAVIVGFPGQTDKDIIDLINFLKYIKFNKVGIFKYSEYPQVKSYSFQNKIPQNIIEKRYQLLQSIFNS